MISTQILVERVDFSVDKIEKSINYDEIQRFLSRIFSKISLSKVQKPTLRYQHNPVFPR